MPSAWYWSRVTPEQEQQGLGINANMLGRWVKEQQADVDGQAFRGSGKLTPDQEELRKLRAQVKRLEMEKDILKKATVNAAHFFAKETR